MFKKPINLLKEGICVPVVDSKLKATRNLQSILSGTNNEEENYILAKNIFLEIVFLQDCVVKFASITCIKENIKFKLNSFEWGVESIDRDKSSDQGEEIFTIKSYISELNSSTIRASFKRTSIVVGKGDILRFQNFAYGDQIQNISIWGFVDETEEILDMMMEYCPRYLTLKTKHHQIKCFRSILSNSNVEMSLKTDCFVLSEEIKSSSNFIDYIFEIKRIPPEDLFDCYLFFLSLKMKEHLYVVCKIVERHYSLEQCLMVFRKSFVYFEDIERMRNDKKVLFKSPLNAVIFNKFKKNKSYISRIDCQIGSFLEKNNFFRCFLTYSPQKFESFMVFKNVDLEKVSFREIYDFQIKNLFSEVESSEAIYSSLILKCKDRNFMVHYEILMLRSEFFRKLLTFEKGKETDQLKKTGVVEIEIFDSNVLCCYLQFIYTKTIKKNAEMNLLLKLANLGEMLNECEFLELIFSEIDILSKKLKEEGKLSEIINKNEYILESEKVIVRFVGVLFKRDDPNIWKPSFCKKKKETSEEEKISQEVMLILNKITPENFNILRDEFCKNIINIRNVKILKQVANCFFKAVLVFPEFTNIYALLYIDYFKKLKGRKTEIEYFHQNFRKFLLDECHEVFNRCIDHSRSRKDSKKIEDLQIVIFVASIIHPSVKLHHEIINDLFKTILWPDLVIELDIEINPSKFFILKILVKFLTKVGKDLDEHDKKKNYPYTGFYFNVFKRIIKSKKVSNIIRCICQDLVDLREIHKWVPRKVPKRVEEPKKLFELGKGL